MKKLFNVLALTLAVNFLAVAGAVGWLYQGKHLDRERVMAIKELLFPKPVEPAATSQPSSDAEQPTTQPVLRLEELLAKAVGRSASEQVEFIQHAFDEHMLILERAERGLNDQRKQIALAQAQLVKDRAALDVKQGTLLTREQEAAKLAGDKGFQDSLTLYNTMPSKQVKTVFMGLDDQTVMNYLQAMQPRTAAKIIKEFKTPDETKRIQTIMERMRTAQAATATATTPPN